MLEALLGFAGVSHRRVHQTIDVVRLRVLGIQRGRLAELLQRDVHLSAFVISGCQLGMELRAILWTRFLLPGLRAALALGRRRERLSATARHEHEHGTDDAKSARAHALRAPAATPSRSR